MVNTDGSRASGCGCGVASRPPSVAALVAARTAMSIVGAHRRLEVYALLTTMLTWTISHERSNRYKKSLRISSELVFGVGLSIFYRAAVARPVGQRLRDWL